MAQITEVIDRPIDIVVCKGEMPFSSGVAHRANNFQGTHQPGCTTNDGEGERVRSREPNDGQ
jgi:hypothetical protein